MKHINTYILSKIKNETNIVEKLRISKKITTHTLFPKSRPELIDMIQEETKKNGNNCSLNHIDVSSIESMAFLFSEANTKFNGDISEWDVSNVRDMTALFLDSHFNGDISEWNVSNVDQMSFMFQDSKFNGDISLWDVSNVRLMTEMFERSEFNQPIGRWNTTNVEDTTFMFCDSKFNQDISQWSLTKCNTTGMLNNCPIKNAYKPKLV